MTYVLKVGLQGGNDFEYGIPIRLFRMIEILNNYTTDRTIAHYSKSFGTPASSLVATDSILRVVDILPDKHDVILQIEGDDEDEPDYDETLIEYVYASYISVIYHLCSGDMKDPILEPTNIIDDVSKCMLKGERLVFDYECGIDTFRPWHSKG